VFTCYEDLLAIRLNCNIDILLPKHGTIDSIVLLLSLAPCQIGYPIDHAQASIRILDVDDMLTTTAASQSHPRVSISFVWFEIFVTCADCVGVAYVS